MGYAHKYAALEPQGHQQVRESVCGRKTRGCGFRGAMVAFRYLPVAFVGGFRGRLHPEPCAPDAGREDAHAELVLKEDKRAKGGGGRDLWGIQVCSCDGGLT